MRVVADERGMMLTELVVALAVMLLVTGGILTSLTVFERTARAARLQNDAQDRARLAIDRLARELRDEGATHAQSPAGLIEHEPYDLVSQAVADDRAAGSDNVRNSRRVRYCLGTHEPASAKRLYMQTQTWTTAQAPAALSTSSCPDAAWGNQQVVAEHVVNVAGGAARALFLYDSNAAAEITEVRARLWIDLAPDERPGETRLEGGVLLRNQNRAPQASFTATRSGRDKDGAYHLLLNGSASDDPDSDVLTYVWKDGDTELPTRGPLVDYATTVGAHSLTLTVRDPGGLSASSSVQDLELP